MFLEDLGRRLRERRELRKLKQGDVAHALQVSPQAVSKWERGENAPDILLLPPLAGLLGVTTDWILGRHENRGDAFDATVFVSSLLGFTARCEGLQPAEVVIWCNGLFQQVTEALLQHGGVPVKYNGDGMLAFFAGGDHPRRATAAALAARAVVTDPLVIGLATGPIQLATVGHSSYARPDILGAAVNRAFRVNQWTMAHAASRIGAAVPDGALADGFRVGEAIVAELKGIAEPIRICEVLGPSGP